MLSTVVTVVWILFRHLTNGCIIARSSQPLVGVLGWRSGPDEAMILAISNSCAKGVVSRHPQTQIHDSIKMAGNGVVVNGVAPHHYYDNCKSLPALVEESYTPPKLLVLDLRSYTTSLANKVKGGGCECKGETGCVGKGGCLWGCGGGACGCVGECLWVCVRKGRLPVGGYKGRCLWVCGEGEVPLGVWGRGGCLWVCVVCM